MHKILFALAFCLLCAGGAIAQKGTAESGYYPIEYHGDTWTGEVTSVNEETREFTLTYTKKDKTQTFIGVLPKGYTVTLKDRRKYELKMSDLLGMYLRAYYIEKEKKVNGQKVKWNDVIDIKPAEKNKF